MTSPFQWEKSIVQSRHVRVGRNESIGNKDLLLYSLCWKIVTPSSLLPSSYELSSYELSLLLTFVVIILHSIQTTPTPTTTIYQPIRRRQRWRYRLSNIEIKNDTIDLQIIWEYIYLYYCLFFNIYIYIYYIYIYIYIFIYILGSFVIYPLWGVSQSLWWTFHYLTSAWPNL